MVRQRSYGVDTRAISRAVSHRLVLQLVWVRPSAYVCRSQSGRRHDKHLSPNRDWMRAAVQSDFARFTWSAEADVVWAYEVILPSGKKRVFRLDGRVVVEQICNEQKREAFRYWMEEAATQISVAPDVFKVAKGLCLKFAKDIRARILSARTLISLMPQQHIHKDTCREW